MIAAYHYGKWVGEQYKNRVLIDTICHNKEGIEDTITLESYGALLESIEDASQVKVMRSRRVSA